MAHSIRSFTLTSLFVIGWTMVCFAAPSGGDLPGVSAWSRVTKEYGSKVPPLLKPWQQRAVDKNPALSNIDIVESPLGPEQVIDAIGGDGGTSNDIRCPSNQVMTGLKINDELVLNAVRGIYCKDLEHLEDDSDPTSVDIYPALGNTIGRRPDDIKAPKGYAMSGFYLQTNNNGSGVMVVGVFQPTIVKVNSTDGVDESTAVNTATHYGIGGSSEKAWVPARCAVDYVMTGLKVHAGKYSIAALGAICQRVYKAGEKPVEVPAGELALGATYEFGPLVYSMGGLGGGYFAASCAKENQAMVGWITASGDVVDSIRQIACMDLNDIATKSGTPEFQPITAGGGGGAHVTTFTPEEGYVMDGWNLVSEGYEVGFVVSSLEPTVISLETSGVGGTEKVGTKAGLGTFYAGSYPWMAHSSPRCPPGYVLTGVKGRAGNYIDALGGICREVVVGK
jgi:hypothetical protein